MIEELKVSLFAQELKTPYPVSVKRLLKEWEDLEKERCCLNIFRLMVYLTNRCCRHLCKNLSTKTNYQLETSLADSFKVSASCSRFMTAIPKSVSIFRNALQNTPLHKLWFNTTLISLRKQRISSFYIHPVRKHSKFMRLLSLTHTSQTTKLSFDY